MREIILGPPGCGKTSALLNLVRDELARGTAPERVAFVTFTRRAAEEAVTRAGAQLGLDTDRLPLFRTLHSLAFRELGLSSAEVFQDARVREFAEWSGIEISPRAYLGRHEREGTPTYHRPADRAMHMENLARVRGVPLRDQYDLDDDDLAWDEVESVALALESFKRRHRLLDFTDMLSRFLVETPPAVDVLVVDEAQDLSPLNWAVVDRLAAGARRVVVAGDDDQAIYRWAGADVERLIAMEGAARVLEQSWRVPGAVQRLADGIIGPVGSRRQKVWRPRPEAGAVIEGALENAETWAGEWRDGVQPVLCLARNTYVLEEHVAPALQRLGVLYEWPAQPPVAPATLAAVHAWERLRSGATASAEAVRGVYRLLGAGDLARGHRELPGVPDDHLLTIEELCVDHGLLTRAPWYEALARRMGLDTVNYLRAARARGERLNQRPRVRLSTVHSAKGGEARRVVLLTEMAARTWREMGENEDDERRVWYVAVTRAREELVVVHGDRPEACPWL